MGGTALAVLVSYHGNVPLLPPVLAALLCPVVALLCAVIGGYLATRLARVRGLATGALNGLITGLAVLTVAGVASGLAPNITLASVLLMIIWTVGGALGGWLTRVRLSLAMNESYD